MNARSITGYEVKRAVISESSAANNEIVAAVAASGNIPAKRIVVLSWYLVVAANAEVITFKSNTTALTGAMTCNAGVQHGQESAFGLFETAAGEALNMTQDGTDQVSGYVNYIEQVETL